MESFEGALGLCIGRIAASHTGLNAVYLPSGLPAVIGESIVREANLLRPGANPFAIIVSDEDGAGLEDIPRVARAESLKYRQGDRLAVVPATTVDIASFDGSFRPVVDAAFPGTATDGFGVEAIAATAVAWLAKLSDASAGERAASVLEACLRQAANVLQEEREGAASWNALWFELVDRGLATLARVAVKMAGRGVSVESQLEQYGCATFALPRPTDLAARYPWRTAKDFVEALRSRWNSVESVEHAIAEDRVASPDGGTPLAAVNAAGLDGLAVALARTPSTLLGLQDHFRSTPERLEAFSEVGVDDFFGRTTTDGTLLVETPTGDPLTFAPDLSSPVYVLTSYDIEGKRTSEPFVIRVPLQGNPAQHLVDDSSVSPVVGKKGYALVDLLVAERSSSEILFEGRLVVTGRDSGRMDKVPLSVSAGAGDTLHGAVKAQSIPMWVAPARRPSLVYAPHTSSTRLGTPQLAEAEADESGASLAVDLRADTAYRVCVIAEEAPQATGVVLSETKEGAYSGTLPRNTAAEIRVSGHTWSLEPTSGATVASHSILTAAVRKVTVDPSDPSADVMTSLLGILEGRFDGWQRAGEFNNALGHVALPSNRPVDFEALHLCNQIQVPEEVVAAWQAASDESEAPSAEWVNARDAFLARWARCVEKLAPVAQDSGTSVRWPSKRSTAALRQEVALVDEMLVAYRELMTLAREEGALVRFASTFPFSVSVWNLQSQAELGAVLLSPWHPIRLAWLTQVEHVLREAERADVLVGSIEGWRFPALARANTKRGRLVAIPMELGREDLFAGWSMMVPLAYDDGKPLSAPTEAAGIPMPGTSASGLTATAADAAVRDFTRVNRHLSSVTIDLASAAPSRRLDDIDRSILDAVRRWAKNDPSAASGIRGVTVFDSLNREGDLPREEALEVLNDASAISLAWRRYAPDPATPMRSNLRLLQDSGVRLNFDPEDDGEAHGALGPAWLRRFEVPSRTDRLSSPLRPAIPEDGSAFVAALSLIEAPDGKPLTASVSVKHSQLADDYSDWSISGDSFVPPAVLARALADSPQSTTSKMLWEWRPPFLDDKGAGALSRRPYASVMKVSSHLVRTLRTHLDTVDPQSRLREKQVISALGTQGIGLSSLLTRGGRHSTGALGFYLALGLINAAPAPEDALQVVMPIDACRQFLDVLSGTRKSKETARQADLLVIRMARGQVQLTPVEVKMYGLEGAGFATLAKPGSDLQEPLEQLDSTVKLLAQVCAERTRLASPELASDRLLWDNSLAALAEAGIRLSESNWSKTSLITDALRDITSGDYELSLAKPLIMHFRHGEPSTPGFTSFREVASGFDGVHEYGALCARPVHVIDALTATPSEADVVRCWAELLDWANDAREENVLADEAGVPQEPARLEEGSESDEVEDVIPKRAALVPDEGPKVVGSTAEETTAHAPAVSRPVVIDASLPPLAEIGPDVDEKPAPGPAQAGSAEPQPVTDTGDPSESLGIRMVLGERVDSIGGSPVDYWPSNTAITQLNIGVVGDLGTGKTQLVRSLVTQLRHQSRVTQGSPTTGLIFDYKGDYNHPDFVAAAGATVWAPQDMPVNPLTLIGDYSKPAAYKRANAFVSTLTRIYGGIGPVQSTKLSKVITGLFERNAGIAPTLAEVLDEYEAQVPSGDAVSSILTTFVMSEIFTEDKSRLLTLEEAMRDAVLVVDLNGLGADFKMKNAIVIMFLDMFYEHMKRLQKVPPRSVVNVTLRHVSSYLLVDEASNIMQYEFDVLESLLKEGREFGVGVILASQFLSHFKPGKTDFAETLATWFIHKVPNVTAKQLSNLGIKEANESMAERIKTLPVHQSLFKSDLTSARFIMETPFWQLIQNPELRDYRK